MSLAVQVLLKNGWPLLGPTGPGTRDTITTRPVGRGKDLPRNGVGGHSGHEQRRTIRSNFRVAGLQCEEAATRQHSKSLLTLNFAEKAQKRYDLAPGRCFGPPHVFGSNPIGH